MDKTYTVTKGGRGPGRVLMLEAMLVFKDEQIKSLTEEMDRWKSAALFYLEKVSKMEKTKPDESKWISVSEMLPEKGEKVLVVVRDDYDEWVDIDFLMSNRIWAFENGDRHTTHWMPLPEPPKEE